MKVALVHDFLTVFGGAERVLQVLGELFPTAPIFTLAAQPSVINQFPGHPIFAALQHKRARDLILYPTLIEQFDLQDYDLVISSSNSFAHGAITREHTRHLCYCHSPARFLWDYTHEYSQERGLNRSVLRPLSSIIQNYLRLWDISAADRPDHYIANSRTVADRIEKYYRVPATGVSDYRQRATVISPPVDLARFHPAKSKNDYYLMVTRLSEYKKVDLAIEAFNQLDRRLLIVGTGRDEERLKQISTSRKIEFLGYQTDTQVAELMARAQALIHPQLEDFGLTIVESLASGTPVVAYGRGGAAEILTHGQHGILFADQSIAGLQQAIKQVASRPFKTNVLQERAKDFSTEKFITQFSKLL
ncbi:glycosyltransferase [Candidatus Berkelbacteria bacterium]|nr:glycosyltransferase [Candidatus Berkelbacteria bacterium]